MDLDSSHSSSDGEACSLAMAIIERLKELKDIHSQAVVREVRDVGSSE
jgi:hypothetical protein